MGLVKRKVKSRPYDNAGRRTQSEATRQRILEAARQLMIERGYRATTVAEIARRGGVHVDTVYELAGRKPMLLRELIEQALSGTGGAVVAEERGYVKAIRAEPDPARKLAIYAGAVREIQARMAPLLLALRDASATEPEAEQVWREISDRRAANMRKLAGDLEDAGGLRAGLSIDEAADVIWATNSSELYVLLTVERGWPPERYERWLADTWCRLLLPDPPRPRI
ncbi:MAG: TetR/AcrR family transcriptional regulator [Actinomycetota bacterium]|nr:TetR/AcrR family transcriptional regulator [Actinomycetota bacterium]